jgi:hypothetical protein
MIRYGLSATIVAGVLCLAPAEPARTAGDRIGDYLPGSKMTPSAVLYLEDDIYFHDGGTKGGVKLHPYGLRVANLSARTPYRSIGSWRPLEVTLS